MVACPDEGVAHDGPRADNAAFPGAPLGNCAKAPSGRCSGRAHRGHVSAWEYIWAHRHGNVAAEAALNQEADRAHDVVDRVLVGVVSFCVGKRLVARHVLDVREDHGVREGARLVLLPGLELGRRQVRYVHGAVAGAVDLWRWEACQRAVLRNQWRCHPHQRLAEGRRVPLFQHALLEVPLDELSGGLRGCGGGGGGGGGVCVCVCVRARTRTSL